MIIELTVSSNGRQEGVITSADVVLAAVDRKIQGHTQAQRSLIREKLAQVAGLLVGSLLLSLITDGNDVIQFLAFVLGIAILVVISELLTRLGKRPTFIQQLKRERMWIQLWRDKREELVLSGYES